jgi:Rrf2 family nitric oxide-sensitive transcriptional repressor
MQVTIFTDYGLRCLMFLSAQEEDKISSVREIADYYSISYNHLVKVVHQLSQLGHIISIKGKGGGLKLAPHARSLRLGDLVKELEPHMDLVECFDKETNSCKITASCELKHYFFEARESFIKSLNKHTLKDTLKK